MKAVEGGVKSADKSRRILRAGNGMTVEVSEKIYQTFYRLRRKERYQEEQKKKYGVISMDAVGYNTSFLENYRCYESEIEKAMLSQWHIKILYEELDRLTSWDKRMIGLLYFREMTIKDTAKLLGCSRGKVIAHRDKVFMRIKARYRREGVTECPQLK